MSARPARRTAASLVALGVLLLVGLVSGSGSPAAAPRAKTTAPERLHAIVKGSAASDVRFTGEVRRSGRTRWCGHLEVAVRQPGSGDLRVTEIFDSGRECGTIRAESVVMLTLACDRALGVGGVLRGRPRLRVERADGSVRAVALRRIRDARDGTFFSVALTADQLPATVRTAGGSVIAEVPSLSEVC